MKTKSIATTLTLSSILLTSCGKTSSFTNQFFQNLKSPLSDSSTDPSQFTFESWSKLVNTNGKSNLQIAKLLAPDIKDRNALLELVSADELSSFAEKFQSSNENFKKSLLYYQAKWTNDESFIKKSLINNPEVVSIDTDTMAATFKMAVAQDLKNKHLTSLIKTYNLEAQRISKLFAAHLAHEINKDVQTKITSLVSEGKTAEAQKLVEKSLITSPTAKKVTSIDQETGDLAIFSIADAIVSALKENDTFDIFHSEIQSSEDFLQKAKELTFYLKNVKKNADLFDSHFQQLAESLGELSINSQKLLTSIKKEITPINIQIQSNINRVTKLHQSFYYDYSQPDSKDEMAQEINRNIARCGLHIQGMSTHLEEMLIYAESSAKLLNIKWGKDVVNVINTANKAVKIASTIGGAMQSFSQGGVLSLSTKLLNLPFNGGFTLPDPTTSALLNIDHKLDQVIDLQKEMMTLQQKTMSMIKDVALMVDDYHRIQMNSLNDIRSIELVNLEILKSGLNKDLRKCEKLISFQLSKFSPSLYKQNPSIDFNLYMNEKSNFYSETQGLKGIQAIIRSTEYNGFTDCQSGLNEAFGSTDLSENPILGIYATSDEQNMKKYLDDVYTPIATFFKSSVENNLKLDRSFNSSEIPLTAPMISFSDLPTKYERLYFPSKNDHREEVYNIDQMISTIGLERYVGPLLILSPLLDFDQPTLMSHPTELVNKFIDDITLGQEYSSYNNRSLFLLKNALFLTRSAIAQQALLSGEPLFDKIYKIKKGFLVLDKNDDLGPARFINAVHSNPLMLKNYTLYSLSQDNAWVKNYNDAYLEKSVSKIQDIVANASGLKGTVKEKNNLMIFTLEDTSLSFTLPTIEQIVKNEIIYPAEMVKLIKIEHKIVDEMIQFAPNFKDKNEKTKLAALLLLHKPL